MNKKISINTLSNRDIYLFIGKLVLFVLVWELAYFFYLKQVRIPDKFLTDILSFSVTGVLNLFTAGGYSIVPNEGGNMLYHYDKAILNIADSCNGLGMMVIYLSVILILPYNLLRKAAFTIGGIIVVIIADIIRCLCLIWIYTKYNSLFDFNHHYVFSLFMFLIILYGWIIYVKKPKVHGAA